MEMDPAKLFVGGISWDTNEERLREYFEAFGEVVEAVIMKDRTTGRARGFGFVVFADPAAAERVVKEKHTIDGRTVEAKKAVPRDDQQTLHRSNGGSLHGSPVGPIRTKKIFVGGLASTVTETDFKNYFDQFGPITDVVVMYDHNTQRPRGFGFITYDSEESVDRVLLRTFHELNGKMVEVKRAVPKEASLGPGPGPKYNYGLSRVNGYINGYAPGSLGGYGVRVDGRFSPVSMGRSGFSPFSPSGYNVGPNLDSSLGLNYGNVNGNGNLSSNLGYERVVGPMYNMSPNRYVSPIGYGGGGNSGSGSVVNSRNVWGNGSQSYPNNSLNSSAFLAHGNGFGGFGANWANSGGGGGSGFVGGGGFSYGNGEGGVGYGRNGGNGIGPVAARDGGDFGGSLFYDDPTWRRSSSPEVDVAGLFDYDLGSGAADGGPKNSVGYVGCSVANRSNRGIAA